MSLTRATPTTRPTRQSRRTALRTALLAYSFMLPFLVLLAVYHTWPVIFGTYLAFTHYSVINQKPPEFVGLGNFRELLQDNQFWSGVKNSLTYILVVPVIQLLSIAVAMLVNRPLKGIGFFRTAYYVPVVTSFAVVGLIWTWMYQQSGPVNFVLRHLGLMQRDSSLLNNPGSALYAVMFVTLWKGIGYYMVLYLAGLQSIGRELEEAAVIDGATRWQVFYQHHPAGAAAHHFSVQSAQHHQRRQGLRGNLRDDAGRTGRQHLYGAVFHVFQGVRGLPLRLRGGGGHCDCRDQLDVWRHQFQADARRKGGRLMTSSTTTQAAQLNARKRRRVRLQNGAAYAVLTLIALIMLYPFYWTLITSLEPTGNIYEAKLAPSGLSFKNYAAVLSGTTVPFLRMVLNSVVICTRGRAGQRDLCGAGSLPAGQDALSGARSDLLRHSGAGRVAQRSGTDRQLHHHHQTGPPGAARPGARTPSPSTRPSFCRAWRASWASF